jgi:hypothetical protein
MLCCSALDSQLADWVQSAILSAVFHMVGFVGIGKT